MDPAVPILMLALIALASGVLCAVVASEKNRNSGTWGVVGFFFPILSLIAIAGMPEKTLRIRECLFCAELIGIKATICPFCNRELKPLIGQYERTIQDLDEAIRLEPQYANTYVSRGNVYRNLGQQERAIQDYDEAIRLDPQYATAYNDRGNAHRDLGQPKRAIQDYDEAIRLNPQYANAYNNRGLTYLSLGKVEEAERDFQKAKELGYQP